ncbi:MAG: hypothetical protein EBR09_07635 [Proteobacteria bacterium]|nr:hypothetical protein [Pseudomonadota bacterium]
MTVNKKSAPIGIVAWVRGENIGARKAHRLGLLHGFAEKISEHKTHRFELLRTFQAQNTSPLKKPCFELLPKVSCDIAS